MNVEVFLPPWGTIILYFFHITSLNDFFHICCVVLLVFLIPAELPLKMTEPDFRKFLIIWCGRCLKGRGISRCPRLFFLMPYFSLLRNMRSWVVLLSPLVSLKSDSSTLKTSIGVTGGSSFKVTLWHRLVSVSSRLGVEYPTMLQPKSVRMA